MPIHINLSEPTIDRTSTSLSCAIPDNITRGRYGFLVLFDARDYPLDHHYCYMQPKNKVETKEGSRRFAEMEFKPNPPGTAVGPWPNWRFIPDMPEINLRMDGELYRGRFNFWGDERETGHLQVIFLATIRDSREQRFELQWKDKRLKPIEAMIYPGAKQDLTPIKTKLNSDSPHISRGLLFLSDDVHELRQRKNTTHQHIWNRILKLRDNWDLEFKLTPESKTLKGPERLDLQDRVIVSAFLALIRREERDIELAQQTFFRFLDIAGSGDFEPMQIDTQAGECLFTACIGYDWLWNHLTSIQKEEAKKNLFAIAELVWGHLGHDREDFAQAHFLGCSHGLLAFSFLFRKEHARAKEWINYFHGVLSWILLILPEDGFYPHGVNLWIYEHIFLLRYLELFRHCAGVNYWPNFSYLQNASLFRGVSLSHDARFGITFGDPQYRVCGDAWLHFLIASRTASGYAQWLGTRLESISTEGVDFRSVTPRRRVWEYLFYDPKIEPTESERDSHHFEDGGQHFWRSASESYRALITFRANGLLGKNRFEAGEWSGYGHSDPCNGSFLITKNDSFLICGPGPVYRRDTQLHNTVTIDDRGQIGDGLPWAPEFIPKDRFARILDRGKRKELEWISADLAPCYLDFLGVEKCTRRFLFIRPGLIIIHDRVQLDQIREIQWNVHSYGTFSPQETGGRQEFLISDEREFANLWCISPEECNWKAGVTEFVPAYPHSGERDHFLRLSKRAKSATFLVIIRLDKEKIEWELTRNFGKKPRHVVKITYKNNNYIV